MADVKVVKLAEFGNSLGTREFGKELREKTLSLIKEGHKVLFDFSNISIISSALADELFGLLLIELGEDEFKNNIKVNKFDNEEVKNLILLIINRALDFRKKSLNPT